MRVRPCIGFGRFEGRCLLQSTEPPYLWCPRCEAIRRKHISGQMDKIGRSLEARRDA